MAGADPDRSGPAISLGVLLLLPYRHLEQRVLDAVVAAGHSITPAQARVFARIDHAGSRLTRLAAASQVTKQTAGFLVGELERNGYVERVPDPADGRARLVRITARGYEVIAVAQPVQQAVEDEWRRHLGPRRMDQLEALLTDLREITDPFAPGPRPATAAARSGGPA